MTLETNNHNGERCVPLSTVPSHPVGVSGLGLLFFLDILGDHANVQEPAAFECSSVESQSQSQ